jgi:bifunctional DNase/RNase
MVEMMVEEVGVDRKSRPVVVLREASGERQLPIWVGPMEADAIAAGLTSSKPPRPMTHDLLCSVLRESGCAVEGLQISGVREGICYAHLHVRVGRKTKEIDCRLSDGVAVAIRVGAPILIPEALLDNISSGQQLSMEQAVERGSLPSDPGDVTIH